MLSRDDMMKICIPLSLLIISSVAAHTQGVVAFNNGPPGQLDNPVFLSDGVTLAWGPQFMASLFAGPTANSLAFVASTAFLRGADAGYFNGGSQTTSIPAGSTGWAQVDVWNTASGATFDQAKASGLPNSWWQSSIFLQSTFMGVNAPAARLQLPDSPAYLNSVPEPSTLALVGLGAVLVLRKCLTLKGVLLRSAPTEAEIGS